MYAQVTRTDTRISFTKARVIDLYLYLFVYLSLKIKKSREFLGESDGFLSSNEV